MPAASCQCAVRPSGSVTAPVEQDRARLAHALLQSLERPEDVGVEGPRRGDALLEALLQVSDALFERGQSIVGHGSTITELRTYDERFVVHVL